MVFQWKLKMSVPASDAAAELDRIYRKYGEIDPHTVVDESRPEGAVLHGLFDWDDASAAEKYRVVQARFIIRNIVPADAEDDADTRVRSYHSIGRNYLPTKVIMSDADMRKRLLDAALRDLEEMKAKYRHLSELAAVFEAADEVLATQKTAQPTRTEQEGEK